jgi:hypothetical protein
VQVPPPPKKKKFLKEKVRSDYRNIYIKFLCVSKIPKLVNY